MRRYVQPAFVVIGFQSDDAVLSDGSETIFSSIPQPDLRKVDHTLSRSLLVTPGPRRIL